MYDDLDRILTKCGALEGNPKKKEIPPVHEVSIDDLIEYIVCPARYFLSANSEMKSNRRIVRDRTRKAINTLVFQNLNKSCIPMSQIEKSMNDVFEGLSYASVENDMKDFATYAVRLSNMLSDNELVIHSPLKPITFVHNNTVVNSDMSFAIKELRNNYIYPVVVDFSKTRYEPSFNPIIYRAHTVAEHFEVQGTTTNIQVFSLGSDRRWIYDHRKYFTAIRASLKETIDMLRADLFPLRFGWWCSSCDYKGLCHKRVKRS